MNFGTIELYTSNQSTTIQPIIGYKVSPSISSNDEVMFSPSSAFSIDNLHEDFNPYFTIVTCWSVFQWRETDELSIRKIWLPFNTSSICYDPLHKKLLFTNFTTANIGACSPSNAPGDKSVIMKMKIAW
jgi:hypothetical protein